MNILVIPTIREQHIKDFLYVWKDQDDWDEIIVVEDNPTKTFDINVEHHYSWEEIKQHMGNDAWIFSRRDSAIRSYGFLKAHQMGAEYIFTLDDDCYPVMGDKGFCQAHIDQMKSRPQWTESVPGVRTRGFPYVNKGIIQNVVANMGLWHCTPDWDAIQTLSGNTPDFNIPNESRIIPKGQYFPFCGMNFGFRADMAVASFFPLMGEGYQYRRFDDIWFGIIFKKVVDHMDFNVSVGVPAIRHLRASSPMTNLVKEAPGIKVNEWFWQFIDDIDLSHVEKKPEAAMGFIGEKLQGMGVYADFGQTEIEYFHKLGQAIRTWTKYFKNGMP